MPILAPKVIFRRAHDITPEYLDAHHIKALILDVDNTLTGHGSQKLSDEIEEWLAEMRAAGIAMMIVSNNMPRRVALFAQQIDLPFRAFSCKPSPIGLAAARRAFGVKKSEIALVGDQIFTDVLGANLYGIPMLLVQPMYADYKPTIRLKRWLEKPVLARYYKRGGKLIQREET
ncbi:MAG: YqeG family HAD IIIA-type phosphatase [Ruthenibacterium sp.]